MFIVWKNSCKGGLNLRIDSANRHPVTVIDDWGSEDTSEDESDEREFVNEDGSGIVYFGCSMLGLVPSFVRQKGICEVM